MNEEFNDENESFREKLKITGFQILGIIIGYTITLEKRISKKDWEILKRILLFLNYVKKTSYLSSYRGQVVLELERIDFYIQSKVNFIVNLLHIFDL